MKPKTLEVVLVKPSKYLPNGFVERYRRGFLPNITPYHIESLTPKMIGDTKVRTRIVDEYTAPDLNYFRLLQAPYERDVERLVAFVGTQSHQFPRAADLAALAAKNGVKAVIGGPHPMTCNTEAHQGKGVSFALAEGELVWGQILADAINGELQPVYGKDQRWQHELESTVVKPPPPHVLDRSLVRMHGAYPARGCPFKCTYCSVTQISGHVVRKQSVEATMASLHLAKKAKIQLIVFGSDNFNKFEDAVELLHAMIEEKINIPFFVQCDTQIADDEELVELLGRAGCEFIFVGVESFDVATLQAAKKTQNKPEKYAKIIEYCRKYGIASTFSNIIGFPNDTVESVKGHIRLVTEMAPGMAWFYILTPIPGTRDYEQFLRDGLITEKNLDRFDCTVPVWNHPNLSHQQLLDLQFGAYQEFYGIRNSFKRVMNEWWNKHLSGTQSYRLLGFNQLMNMAAARQRHPMSGGVGRRNLDRNVDFAHIRRSTYGYDLLPLPDRLEVPEKDQAFTQIHLSGSLKNLKKKREEQNLKIAA